MNVSPPQFALPPVRPNDPAAARPAGGVEKGNGAAFTQTLTQAVGALEEVQRGAESAVDALARGQGNLHHAALALETADIGLRLATKVRGKVVEAYQDVMRIPL